MDRYHFNVDDGVSFKDENGTEFADRAAVKEACVRYLADLLKARGDSFWDHPHWKITVTDANGRALMELELNAKETAE